MPYNVTCERCNRTDFYCSRRMASSIDIGFVGKYLCVSCRVCLLDHKKRVEGSLTVKNRESAKKYMINWFKKKENKEKHRNYMRAYYYKHKTKNNSRSLTYQYRTKILKKHGNKCGECGSTENLEIDHLEYKYTVKELMDCTQVLCRNCHRRSHRLENR